MPSLRTARNAHLLSHLQVDDEIEIWWPLDQMYYLARIIKELPGDLHRVIYFDGEVEDVRLATEQWRFQGAAALRVMRRITAAATNNVNVNNTNHDR